MSVCDGAPTNWTFQHGKPERKWNSAISGVQNVLLVHGHTTVDVDATVWWSGRWSLGQTSATLQSDAPCALRLSMSWKRVNEKRAPPVRVLRIKGLDCWTATSAGYEAECLPGQLLLYYVYGRVSVNKEDILNTGYSWISLPFRFSMLESSIFWCCILNAHKLDKLTNISNRL